LTVPSSTPDFSFLNVTHNETNGPHKNQQEIPTPVTPPSTDKEMHDDSSDILVKLAQAESETDSDIQSCSNDNGKFTIRIPLTAAAYLKIKKTITKEPRALWTIASSQSIANAGNASFPCPLCPATFRK